MSDIDRMLIGELKASVKDLQEGQDKLFGKTDALNEKVDRLLGRLENYHTPITCPHSKTISELQAFRFRVLGMASALSVLVTLAVKWLWERVTGNA